MSGQLSKNFHGVGNGPLSKILAVKVFDLKGSLSGFTSSKRLMPHCVAVIFSFQSCVTSNSVKLKVRKFEYCQTQILLGIEALQLFELI